MGKKAAEKKDGPREAEAAAEDPQEARALAQYDLLPKMTPFLDRHMINVMLHEAKESKLYKAEDVTRALLQIAYDAFLPDKTLLEQVEALYKSLGEDVEEKWHSRRDERVQDANQYEAQVMPLLQVLEKEDKVSKILNFKFRSAMCDEFELDPDAIESLVPYAKKVFEAGQYAMSSKLLRYYADLPQADPLYYVIKYAGAGEIIGLSYSSRDDADEAFERTAQGLDFGKMNKEQDREKDSKSVILVDCVTEKAGTETLFQELMFHGKSRDHIPDMQAWWEEELARKKASEAVQERKLIWGSLAAAILMPATDETSAEVAKHIVKMDEHLNTSEAPKREILLHRTWLLHWALFAIFRSEKLDAKVLDLFLSEKSLSIISLSCPHLFRYVGACLILQKRLKHIVKETVWIIHHEASSYSDPITRFLLALYTDMDYDEAQQELQKCEQLCKGDFFLKSHWQELQENARLHIFESYCRIHQCINIQMIAEKLNMQAEEAELWIVKLIQNAKLDARIDSEKSRVVMTKAPPSVYQQVIEKTKNLAFRSTMLVSNLEKSY